MSSSLIHIIIPYYKERAFLDSCVHSVLAQTNPNWSLTVVDDSIHEGDSRFVKELVSSLNDQRIDYRRKNKNTGIRGAWNYCLSLFDEGLVTILHADDCLKPEYVERVLEANICFPSASAFFTKSDTIDECGRSFFSFIDKFKNLIAGYWTNNKYLCLQGEKGLSKLLRGNFIVCPTICYRIVPSSPIRFDRFKQVLDYDMTTRILLNGGSLIGIGESLLSYRRHEGNLSLVNLKDSLRFKEELLVYERINRKAIALNWRKSARRARHKIPAIMFHLYSSLHLKMNREHSNNMDGVKSFGSFL